MESNSDAVLDITLRSVIWGIQLATQHMQGRGGGACCASIVSAAYVPDQHWLFSRHASMSHCTRWCGAMAGDRADAETNLLLEACSLSLAQWPLAGLSLTASRRSHLADGVRSRAGASATVCGAHLLRSQGRAAQLHALGRPRAPGQGHKNQCSLPNRYLHSFGRPLQCSAL